ncbi:hypothetical protein DXX93_17200 [Thalassotalea euphylliae]|uniref:Uncharacterized protein n=1 Tax=Thalassotalea euphylliae TaxID=1655234 RepID=A0A3E0TUI1_9GAMM|nr:hypothetical protein [Thalassotalea euphylliae]REL28129.1 hypothetical protein DXX93_17200 [Thalassotalea euphylliae]
MSIKLKEKFVLQNGVTILACLLDDPKCSVVGRKFQLVSEEGVKQTLTIIGERSLLQRTAKSEHRAFETRDSVMLSSEEIRTGDWMLIE